MSRAIFYNRRRQPYMSKLSLGTYVNESEDYEYIPRTQDEIEELADAIKRAALKLNNIRKACKSLDPDFEGKLIDITKLKIADKTLDDLNDMIYDEQSLLDAYNNESEEMEEDELDPDEIKDSDIFDSDDYETEDEFLDEPVDSTKKPVVSKSRLMGKTTLPEYNPNDNIETLFFKTMQYFWMTRTEAELIDDFAFYMNLKKEPGVDYLVIPITVFNDRSIIFKVLSIDGEEQNHLEPTIYVKDIDLTENHTDFMDLVDIFEKETR